MNGCPDCSATWVVVGSGAGPQLCHDLTCPLGLALDRVFDADRVWFEEHPGFLAYVRPVSRAEVDELLAMFGVPEDFTLTGDVVVVSVAPGIRLRRLGGLVAVARRAEGA